MRGLCYKIQLPLKKDVELNRVEKRKFICQTTPLFKIKRPRGLAQDHQSPGLMDYLLCPPENFPNF